MYSFGLYSSFTHKVWRTRHGVCLQEWSFGRNAYAHHSQKGISWQMLVAEMLQLCNWRGTMKKTVTVFPGIYNMKRRQQANAYAYYYYYTFDNLIHVRRPQWAALLVRGRGVLAIVWNWVMGSSWRFSLQGIGAGSIFPVKHLWMILEAFSHQLMNHNTQTTTCIVNWLIKTSFRFLPRINILG